MTFDNAAIERLLIEQGVPPAMAHARAFGMEVRTSPTVPRNVVLFAKDNRLAGAIINVATDEMRQIAWPFRLTLPWSHLVSDNHRYAAGTERTGGGLLLTTDYRRCRGLIRDRALDALGTPHPEPAHIPLQITASVWVPDNRPHDCTNFAKVVHDGLEKIVYSNDRWLYAAHWKRAGVDVDAPRAEIEIRPLATPDL